MHKFKSHLDTIITLAVSATGSILEWGECLPDCPQETVTQVCIMEPQFPAYAYGKSGSVNFTSNYIPGSMMVTNDVSFFNNLPFCVFFFL